MILAESLQGLSVVCALWILTVAIPRSRLARTRSVLYVLSGVILGISSALRPTALVLVAATVLVLMIDALRRKTDLKSALAGTGLLVLGTALSIAPFAFHNLFVAGEPILLSANGGFNFWIGNHAGASGTLTTPPGYSFTYDPLALELARQDAGSTIASPPTSAPR